jgi:isopentenyl-diphosphate delta-isomerase
MLLQQRAAQKYHGAHLWTNACCSHPYSGERIEVAAQRRLKEELGFTTSLEEIFSFTYRAEVENNLIEHEFDHVFAGEYEGEISANENEVADVAYESMDKIKEDMEAHPERFTSWFKIAFPKIESWWKERFGV